MINYLSVNTREKLSLVVRSIDPELYSKTRNYTDGAVTKLSPFITHGILSPLEVLNEVISLHGIESCGKLISEFAWREYFQRVWQNKGDEIFTDLKQAQADTEHEQIPKSITDPDISCGINVLDDSINQLTTSGYIHNHSRMWIAGAITNIAKTHWKQPASWMFYHLLDGDLASNTLSWQWVAGSFSHKKYIANQDNLNRFSKTSQQNTWLDMSYEELAERDIPAKLTERCSLKLNSNYPKSTIKQVNINEDLLLYSIWNLDDNWHCNSNTKRILVIEPSVYDRFPMGPKRWGFITLWASHISNLEIFVGELCDLIPKNHNAKIIHREYPLCGHWPGDKEPRNWIFPETTEYFSSFSKYYKIARKQTNNVIFK